jgi:hypothetical protein
MPTDKKMEDKLFVFCAFAAADVFLSHGPDSSKTSAREEDGGRQRKGQKQSNRTRKNMTARHTS